MLPDRLRDTSIVWRFALTSLVVFALIGLGIAALRGGDLRSRSEAGAAIRARLIAQGAVAPLLRPADLQAPIEGARYDELDAAIHRFAMDGAGIERIKIWSPDGVVLFSNDPAQVGLSPEPEEDLLEAFEGEIESEISDLDEAENVSERRLADRLFETYVPIDVAGVEGPEHADAVVEVYQDYSAIQAEIDALNRTLTIWLGLGLLALYVLLLPVMIGTTRTLRRQNATLQEQAAQLGELLEREQGTVAELRELDRLKSDFVAAASHELRTPLTTIRGYADLLRERTGDEASTRDAIDTIARQTAHLHRLVGNLLRESRLEHGDPIETMEDVAPGELLEDVRKGFPGAVDRISMRIDGSIPVVRTDRIALHEIVANLVDNALKYSEPGSTVEVESALESGALVIRVRDRGDGIPAGDLPRIFDRFTQLDGSATRAHGGVGLGLHLVRELSRRLGGDVAVDSVVGRGTVFTVTIPVTSATSDRDPEQSELSSA
ncbi:MAG TPA: ATP-binding protein [Actinomycetota bacterium]